MKNHVEKRRRPFGQRLLRRVAVLVALYLGAEAAAWLVYALALSAERRAAVAEIRETGGLSGPMGLTPHPFSLFQPPEDGPAGRGARPRPRASLWRGADVATSRPAGLVRVVCLGGDNTYGVGCARPEEAYPARLESLLNEASQGRRVEVVNAGVPLASSAELFGFTALGVIHLKPDVVILQVGLQDVSALLAPDVQPDYTHWRKSWVAPRYSGTVRRLLGSPLYRLLFVAFVLPAAEDLTFQVRPDREWDDPALAGVPRREPTAFRMNVEALLAITLGRGMRVMLVTERLRRPLPLVDWAVAAHNQALEDLGRKHGLPVCRFDRVDVPDTAWADDRHLNADGLRLLAEVVRRDLAAAALTSAGGRSERGGE